MYSSSLFSNTTFFTLSSSMMSGSQVCLSTASYLPSTRISARRLPYLDPLLSLSFLCPVPTRVLTRSILSSTLFVYKALVCLREVGQDELIPHLSGSVYISSEMNGANGAIILAMSYQYLISSGIHRFLVFVESSSPPRIFFLLF